MPISAIDSVNLALQHTKQRLLQPFRFWQWTRLAIVGLLAGEAGSSFNFHAPSNPNVPQGGAPNIPFGHGWPNIDPMVLGSVLAVLVISGVVFAFVMLYISSVMRFILFDSVLTRECHIRAGWTRRQGPGWNLFLWQIGYAVVAIVAVVVLLGFPALFAYSKGWFHPPADHVPQLVMTGIAVFLLFGIFAVVAAVVHVFTKDFVVPQMALEGIGPIEAWRRLLPQLQAEAGSYVVYAIMKVVLAIAFGILIGVVSFILGLLIAIPAVGVGLAAILAGKTAGLTWNVLTITAAIVAGCILLAFLFYVIALIGVPAIVFFPAYAMYFFAGRYPALNLALYPVPEGAVSPPPPHLPPAPAPAG